jgi:putative FmdB family regulatory protein
VEVKMPIYEYICMKCNEKFSVLQNIHSSEGNTKCPKCASREVKKAISAFSCASGSGSGDFAIPAPGISAGG